MNRASEACSGSGRDGTAAERVGGSPAARAEHPDQGRTGADRFLRLVPEPVQVLLLVAFGLRGRPAPRGDAAGTAGLYRRFKRAGVTKAQGAAGHRGGRAEGRAVGDTRT